MSDNALNTLLDERQLWRAGQRQSARHGSPSSSVAKHLATGFAELDAALHLGGWPQSGSSELFCQQQGIGELWLLLPALKALVKEAPIAWLNPPYLPYTHALAQQGLPPQRQLLLRPQRLAEQLWSAEEVLRSGAFSALLCWFSAQQLQDRQLRRLHLAAREGHCWHLHFRPVEAQVQASPAPLRLALGAAQQQLQLQILKQAGGPAGQTVLLPRPAALYYQQQPVTDWPSYTSADRHSHKRQRFTVISTAPLSGDDAPLSQDLRGLR